MKQFMFLIAFAFAANVANAQMQKSLIKTFNLNGATVVMLDLKGEVLLKPADNTALRLQTDIDLKNGNISLFQAFLAKKRYDVQTKAENGTFTLTAPDRENVKIGGQDLQETVSYTLYVPDNVTTKMVTDGLHTYIYMSAAGTVAAN
jgi:hypothetical protein